MKTTGIVAEYNPFHNGHKYLIDELKNDGSTHIVAVMSGNFVQRGSFAIAEKRVRAKAALESGVDLVVELPVPWSVSNAQTFALGSIQTLMALNCVDNLGFGCECSDLEKLISAKNAVTSKECDEKIVELLSCGISYPSARANAVSEIYGKEMLDIVSTPNNILAIEYLKAMDTLSAEIKPTPVKRMGPVHDSDDGQGNFTSASAIRNALVSKDTSAWSFMPAASAAALKEAIKSDKAPVNSEYIDRIVLSRLRTLSVDDIKKAPDISEGLENRILNAIQSASSLYELFDMVKTKRYTHARIRRIIMNIFLGIEEKDTAFGVPYIRVLGFNKNGQEILKIAKEKATLPIVMKASQINPLSQNANYIFNLECKATDLYTLAMPAPYPCYGEMTDQMIIV